MIIYGICCLCITLTVLQIYVSKDTHAHTHRLLPLVLGLCAVYDFYETVKYITGLHSLFCSLEDLLLIQLLYLLLCYARDFLQVNIRKWYDFPLFLSLIIADIYILYHFNSPEKYDILMVFIVLIYEVMILIVGTYAYWSHSGSRTKRDRRITTAIFLALIVPSICAFLKIIVSELPDCILLTGVTFSCLIVFYLIKTDQLIEPAAILHEQVFSNSELPLILFDKDFYYLNSNNAAKNLFPMELKSDTKSGKKMNACVEIYNLCKQTNPETDIPVDNKIYRCSIKPVYYKEKNQGYLLSFMDITDQKNENKKMLEKKNYAEQQTLLKSQFLSRMSHDLRTPLHAIIGISDILLTQNDQSVKNKDMITQINTSGKNLLEQVNVILDYSKLEAHKLELVKHSYRISPIFSELAKMCYANLKNRPIVFNMSVETNFYDALCGDSMRVREIIQNILSNAMKYTDEGSITCKIYCEKRDHRAYYSCVIKDTGNGMSQNQIEHIYTEYMSYTANSMEESSGLGMVIVRQLTELMDGEVKIESDGVKGTCVTVSFYQEIEDEKCILFPEKYTKHKYNISMLPDEQKLPSAIYPMAKILVADDMDINLSIFTEMTKPWEFAVYAVHNGDEAIEAVKKENYDLIFLDMFMPGKTGLETAESIREITNTPLVLLSANLLTEVNEEYRDCGFVDVLEKPIRPEKLKRIVEEYLPFSKKIYREEDFFQRSILGNDVLARDRIINAFVKEMKSLAENFPDYVNDNLELFRAKTHGIKGVSKQLSLIHLAEQAEIMEMAAKTTNLPFIHSHLDSFIDELRATISVFEQEQQETINTEQALSEKKESLPFSTLMKDCKKALEAYDYIGVEKVLETLSQGSLDAEQKALYDKLQKFLDELEYEEGILAIEQYEHDVFACCDNAT